ncbi:MAG: FtsX-like permease family protein [Clostridium sp.]
MKNKKRNLFLATTLMLFSLFVITVGISNEFLIEKIHEDVKNISGGYWDVYASGKGDIGRETLYSMAEDSIVSDSAEKIILGDLTLEDKGVNGEEYKLQVESCDEEVLKFMNSTIIEGGFPKADNEIALEDWIVPYIEGEVNIGDYIELDINMKTTKDVEHSIKDKYKIVGIFKNKVVERTESMDTAYGYVSKNYAESIGISQFKAYRRYYSFKPNVNIINGAQDLESSYKGRDDLRVKRNNNKYEFEGTIKYLKLVENVSIFIVSVVFIVLIYNVFNSSILLRVKEIGMLKSLGATSRKIKLLLLGEGLTLGIISITLGIVLSNFLVQLIMKIIFKGDFRFSLFSVSINNIVSCYLVGLCSIIIGAYSSAKKSSKLSIIEAMNYENKVIKGNRSSESSLEFERYFEKSMADNNIKRNKKKYISTVIALSLTITMFITIDFICRNGFIGAELDRNHWDFSIENRGYNLNDESVKSLEELSGIRDVKAFKKEKSYYLNIPKDVITDNGMSYVKDEENNFFDFTKNKLNQGIYLMQASIYSYEDDEMKLLDDKLKKGDINLEEMKDGNNVILVEDIVGYDYYTYKVGDTVRLLNFADEEKEFKISAIIEGKNCGDKLVSGVGFIMTEGLFNNNFKSSEYNNIDLYMDNESSYEDVKYNLNEYYGKNNRIKLSDYKEVLKFNMEKKSRYYITYYGFIGVIAIASISNLFNIMTMNVVLRKKEISVLRVIGMSKDEVRKMILWEGIYYIVPSIIIGIILGVVMSYKVFVSYSIITSGITFIIIAIIAIFVTIISSLNACKEVFTDSIVEGITSIE